MLFASGIAVFFRPQKRERSRLERGSAGSAVAITPQARTGRPRGPRSIPLRLRNAGCPQRPGASTIRLGRGWTYATFPDRAWWNAKSFAPPSDGIVGSRGRTTGGSPSGEPPRPGLADARLRLPRGLSKRRRLRAWSSRAENRFPQKAEFPRCEWAVARSRRTSLSPSRSQRKPPVAAFRFRPVACARSPTLATSTSDLGRLEPFEPPPQLCVPVGVAGIHGRRTQQERNEERPGRASSRRSGRRPEDREATRKTSTI